MTIFSPLFDAARRARRTTEPEARGDAPRPDAFRMPWRAAASHLQGRSVAKDGRRSLTAASTVAGVMIALSPLIGVPASAERLTVTEIATVEEARDPKNVYGNLAMKAWADGVKQLEQTGDNNFGFVYVAFKVGGKQYLASMLDSRLCSRTDCAWIVQRLSPSYEAAASGPAVEACAERDKIDLTAGKLTICGKVVPLP